MILPSHFLAIDEFGRFLENEARIQDHERIERLFQNLRYAENGALTSSDGAQDCLVEAFEAPWVIVDLQLENGRLKGQNTYGFSTELDLQGVYFDEWDRLHGRNLEKIPWVLSRSAQEILFDLLDEFDDEGFVMNGQRYATDSGFQVENPLDRSTWWSELYETPGAAGWDLKAPHPAFVDTLPRLKLPRSRVLVLGCGEGHDAAYFAKEGHVVTAADFSDVALQRAQKNYGHLPIQFVQADALQLPRSFDKSYDFLIEHTLYCAIDPARRAELVQTWNRCLLQGGYFMGVFFAVEKRSGPPFGSTEWEIRQRLQKDFHMLFWGRWRQSPGARQGRELFTLAQKK
ncbi:MAG: class I SAM-dependent methyltransferase [Bdellovibrionales bacterium]